MIQEVDRLGKLDHGAPGIAGAGGQQEGACQQGGQASDWRSGHKRRWLMKMGLKMHWSACRSVLMVMRIGRCRGENAVDLRAQLQDRLLQAFQLLLLAVKRCG